MIQLQLINKILSNRDISIIKANDITSDYLIGYESEYNFIMDHYNEYGNVPDTSTFLDKFPEFELLEVHETDDYLVHTLREEYLFNKSVPVVQQIAKLLEQDSNEAVQYMLEAVKELKPNYRLGGIDIVSQAQLRLEEYKERKENQNSWFFSSGFPELDEVIHGIQRKEEFFVILARTNQGKSWVLEKMCASVWSQGYNVGYISPEMGPISIGYRFDTLVSNFSNKALMWGQQIDMEQYSKYIENLKQNKNKFIVSVPQHFNNSITRTKLTSWIQQNNLNFVAIDGITYIKDERGKRGDNNTTRLTNVSEDLMSLSNELGVPIVVVAQSNRSGVNTDNKSATPELDSIRDSDGIAFNASKVISIRQAKEDNLLVMEVKKQRFGKVGGKLTYHWNIDIGDFQFIPSYEDAESTSETESKVENIKKKYVDKEDVF